uniref:Uncharacterized protein n=2 Tax=Prymnesium polylepis TaxID=72548 RepID=A0A6T8ATT5_9EUKA
MSCISRRMHRNSPSSAITTTLTQLTTHHSQLPGNPSYNTVQHKWIKCVVAVKSRHFLARSTTTHRKQPPASELRKKATMDIQPPVDERRIDLSGESRAGPVGGSTHGARESASRCSARTLW